jgi:hypothetical protein
LKALGLLLERDAVDSCFVLCCKASAYVMLCMCDAEQVLGGKAIRSGGPPWLLLLLLL